MSVRQLSGGFSIKVDIRGKLPKPSDATMQRRELLRVGLGGLLAMTFHAPSVFGAPAFTLVTVDDVVFGYARSITGGTVSYDAVSSGLGEKAAKHAKPKARIEDAIVELPLTASKVVLDWVNTLAATGTSPAKRVVLSELDANYKLASLRILEQATLVGVELPALDPVRAAAATIKLRLSPTNVVFEKGNAERIGSIGRKEKVATTDKFAVSIEGLATARLGYAESLVLSRSAQDTPVFSNLVLEVPNADIAGWKEWLAKGNGVRRDGSVAWLDGTGNSIVTLDMHGMSLVSLSAIKAAGTSRSRVVLAIETLGLFTSRQ